MEKLTFAEKILIHKAAKKLIDANKILLSDSRVYGNCGHEQKVIRDLIDCLIKKIAE